MTGFAVGFKYRQESAAFVGHVLVDSKYRGWGIGTKIVDACCEYLQDVRSVMLFATEAGYPMYQRRGFVDINRDLACYSLLVTEDTKTKLPMQHSQDYQLIPFDTAMMEDVITYDTTVNACSRAEFLKALLEPEKITAIVAVMGGVIQGYGCVERMHSGAYWLGPVYAKQSEVAEQIFSRLILNVPNNRKVTFYAHDSNVTMKNMTTRLNVQFVSKEATMLKGEDINICSDAVYCISDSDMGII